MPNQQPESPFTLALNTSTIRCGDATLVQKIEATARAGFAAIEPWVAEIDEWTSQGRTLADLRRHIAEAGLQTVNLIGFFKWAVNDPAEREAALKEATRACELAAALECPFIAAPPMGIADQAVNLRDVSTRFQEVCQACLPTGVTPLVEYWGHARTLGTAGEALQVLADADVPKSRLLADVFHTYKSSGHFRSFELMGAPTLGLFHLNDVPRSDDRSSLTDAQRVYPGDGDMPLVQILETLAAAGYRGPLSVELFNKAYWQQPIEQVAQAAFDKAAALLQRCQLS